MEYYLETENARKHDWIANNPTLEEMTRSAINMLKKDANGFVLLVEGVNHAGLTKDIIKTCLNIVQEEESTWLTTKVELNSPLKKPTNSI